MTETRTAREELHAAFVGAMQDGNWHMTADEDHAKATAMVDAAISEALSSAPGTTSDGFHTFDELYHHRTILFMLLQPHLEAYRCPVWKSRLHEDGTMFPGFFIAGVETPQGQATYHCLDRYWDLFEVPEVGRAPAFDGHTPDDTLARLFAAMTGGQKLEIKP